MDIDKSTVDKVLEVLHEEVVIAEGCTEPIAIALVAAKVREVLEHLPDKMKVYASGNIIKNVKSVVVPNSGGMVGIKSSAALGAVAGDCKKDMMVISEVKEDDIEKANKYRDETPIEIHHEDTPVKLYIRIEAFYKDESAVVEIQYLHTNLTRVEKNGKVLLSRGRGYERFNTPKSDRDILTVKLIHELTKNIELERITPLFEKVISLNSALAEEGLKGSYGVNIGSSIQKNMGIGIYGEDRRNQCASYAAAASDARMSGCPLPVMTTFGSGNMGITASLPIIKYCELRGFNRERLIRALFLSHLTTIHIKTQIGRLSAYCGPVSAAAGVSGALTYLIGGDYETIAHTVVNTLGNISGIICDGAKPSCAMKIATSIYAAFDSATLAFYHNDLHGGEGIVGDDVEATIKNIGELASSGMEQTDETILKIMTG